MSGSDDGAGTGNGAGSGADKQPIYVEQLADDLKKLDWSGYPTVSDVFRAHLKGQEDLKRLEHAVVIPGAEASDAERKAYREKMGIPMSEQEYGFNKVNVPPGMVYDKETETWFKKLAYDNELTKNQATGLFDAYAKRMIEAHYALLEKANQRFADSEKKQKETWGDKYQENLEKSQKAIEKFGPEGFAAFLTESQLGNNPLMIQFCLNVAEAIAEDFVPKGQGPGGAQEGKPGQQEGQMYYDKSPDMYKDKR